MAAKTTVAFFGLGTMGMGMARRILQHKHKFDLIVYNRNTEKAASLAAEGAIVATTPANAAHDANILIAMLADDYASRSVWLDTKVGALAAAKSGSIVIDCSTISVPWVRELAAAAEERGLQFLDAPVTGTKPHAANGELTFLVGGSADILEKVRPLLAVMSKEIIHLGPTGRGAALKLINNFVCGVQAVALAEANALLRHAGLDLAKALPVLVNGALGSPIVKMLSTRHANKDYTPNFQLRLMAKDLTYAIAEAQRPSPSTPDCRRRPGNLQTRRQRRPRQ